MPAMSHWRGISWFILHLLAGTTGSIFIRMLSQDFQTFQIVFMYNLMGLIFLLPWVLSGGIKKLRSSRPKTHIIRAVLGVISFAFWVTGLSLIPFASAASLAQTTPLLTTLFAVLIIGEKIGKHRVSALIAGFAGAIVILRPGTEAFDFASLFILGAVITRAISDIVSKNLAQSDSTRVNVFYLFLGIVIFSFPLAMMSWTAPNISHAPILLTMGIVNSIVAISMIKAYEHEDLTTLMPFAFIGLLAMFASGYIFFDEKIDIYTLAGGIIIITSCMHVLHRQHKKAKEIIHDPGE